MSFLKNSDVVFNCKLNESEAFKSYKYSEKLFYVFKNKRKFKSTEITDPVSRKLNSKSTSLTLITWFVLNFNFQFLLNLKQKVEDSLIEIKKSHKFELEDYNLIDQQKSENIEFINKFHQVSSEIIFRDFFGENNLDYSHMHTIQNQSFIIPPKCKFFNKDIRKMGEFLDANLKFDFVVADPCWKNRYIKRTKKFNKR